MVEYYEMYKEHATFIVFFIYDHWSLALLNGSWFLRFYIVQLSLKSIQLLWKLYNTVLSSISLLVEIMYRNGGLNCTVIADDYFIYVYLKKHIDHVVLNAHVTRHCVQCLRSYQKQQMKCCKFHMSLKQTLKSMEKACWRSVNNMLLIRKVRCLSCNITPCVTDR